MGFTSGLYSVPKYKGLTLNQITYVENYLLYDYNGWAKQNFKSANEYASYYETSSAFDITEDILQFYKAKIYQDEYNHYGFAKEFGSWCSGGILMHEHLGGESRLVLDKSKIYNMIEFAWSELLKLMPEECQLNYAFKYEDDDSIKLIPCDGVEVQFETGAIRIEANEYEELAIPKQTDMLMLYTWKSFIESLYKILKEVDFDNEIVYYSGGW